MLLFVEYNNDLLFLSNYPNNVGIILYSAFIITVPIDLLYLANK